MATVCVLTPLFLWFFDGFQIRDSISAYYDMEENQIFYVPLTVVVMLFVVNGVVKHQTFYNTVLGVALAGLVLFNHDDFNVLHGIFVVTFFGGNVIVILFFSSMKKWWFRAPIVAGIVLSLLGHFVFGWFSLFWAEWASLLIIAGHYVIETWVSLTNPPMVEAG